MSALYIHIPFCLRKCFYCSFAVSISQEHRFDEYIDALIKEASPFQGQKISTIYFGGGTPSILSTAQFDRLFAMIRSNFNISEKNEITIEANPENIDLEKARHLRQLGVNRVSLGIQTLNEKYLKYLGRVHDSFKALSAFNDLRRAGFDNINVDLMYSFPGQTAQEIEEDIKIILGLGSEHVSIYTLTVEENSKFFARKITEQNQYAQADQFELVSSLLDQGGIKQYEVSNFSRSGFQSVHNRNYWEGGNYIGLGMSSHSHQNGRRSWNVSKLSEYLNKIASGASPEEGFEQLDLNARLCETLIFGLRMNEGIDLDELSKRFGAEIPWETKKNIEVLINAKLLIKEKDRLKTTPQGRLVLDMIAVKLI